MFLASIGMASANPSTDTFGSNEPNPVVASPQQAKHTIKGVVEDQFGPIAGANVVEKGTTNGTITDMDGNFSLEVAPNSILIVSFIGYKEQQIPVNSQKTVTIKLTEDSQALEEVVVVGYGTQKKVNLSGSVTSVNVSEMAESRPLTNISTALAGTAPGVQITSSNNIPSNNGDADIKVRGQGTLNNSSPLVIIDGVEGSLNSVSPQDVETVSVLKDAASSAIYGSRAANGVILITTKSGKSGKMKLDYTGYVSFQTLDKPYDVVSDYASYMEYLNEGMTNSNKPAPFSQNVINLWREKSKDPNGLNEYGMPNYLAYPNSDIFDVYETGVSHQHNLSASGGSEKITYYTSFNYLNNPGILENCGYERFSLRANIDSQIKDWLKLGVNLSGYTANTTPVSENIKDIYTYGLTGGNPGIAYLDDQNRLGINANAEDDPQNATNNPYNRLRNTTGNVQTNTLKTRLYAILTPLKGLTIQGSYTYDYYDKFKESKPNFVPMYNFQTNTLYTDGVGQTSIYNYNEKTFRNFMDATIRYERNFFDDRLSTNLMVGASQEQYKRQYFSATRKDLIDPSLGVIDGAIGESSSTGNITEWAMRSYFGRLNLGWDDKYLFEANLRADGSSRFLADNRWGYFPSFSAAWRISDEAWMKQFNNWLDNAKLRLSYGVTGNNNVDDYVTIATASGPSYVVLGGSEIQGYYPNGLVNTGLIWEKVKEFDLGLDFSVLSNRINLTADFYHRLSDGQIMDRIVPVETGETKATFNVGSVRNTGIELGMQFGIIRSKDFIWDLSVNYSRNWNKILELSNGKVDEIASNRFIGEPLNVLRDYIHTDVITDKGVTMHTKDGDIHYTLQELYAKYGSKYKWYEGQIAVNDWNNDGKITDEDKQIYGCTDPKWVGSLSSNMYYKGFDFSVMIYTKQGQWARSYFHDKYMKWSDRGNQHMAMDFYIPKGAPVIDHTTGDIVYATETHYGEYPYPNNSDTSAGGYFSDKGSAKGEGFQYQKTSFVKVKNICLGYTFPKKWITKAGLQHLRLYINVLNPFCFTDYDGFDPEWANAKLTDGGPASVTYQIGANIKF